MNLNETGPAQGFWALLTDDERAVLSDLGRITVFPPGATMCVEGDPATHVFILMDGWVKILGVTSDGHELVLALRGQGDVVGELAGETTGYRTASVQAIGTVRALIVGFEKFSSFLDSHLGADHAYRRMFARRWSDTDIAAAQPFGDQRSTAAGQAPARPGGPARHPDRPRRSTSRCR